MKWLGHCFIELKVMVKFSHEQIEFTKYLKITAKLVLPERPMFLI